MREMAAKFIDPLAEGFVEHAPDDYLDLMPGIPVEPVTFCRNNACGKTDHTLH